MILDRYFFWNPLGILLLLSVVAFAHENTDTFEFEGNVPKSEFARENTISNVSSAFASPRYTFTATPHQLQFFQNTKYEITNALLKLKKSGVLEEKIIVALSIACDWWTSTHENPELSVSYETDKVIILTKTIVADENLKRDCRNFGIRQPPPYFHNSLGSSADYLHYDCVTVFKCGQFDAKDFSLMKNYTLFKETFPLHEKNTEDDDFVSMCWVLIRGYSLSALSILCAIFFATLSYCMIRLAEAMRQADERERRAEIRRARRRIIFFPVENRSMPL